LIVTIKRGLFVLLIGYRCASTALASSGQKRHRLLVISVFFCYYLTVNFCLFVFSSRFGFWRRWLLMKAIDVACMLIYVGLTEFNPRQLKQNATGMSLHATNW